MIGRFGNLLRPRSEGTDNRSIAQDLLATYRNNPDETALKELINRRLQEKISRPDVRSTTIEAAATKLQRALEQLHTRQEDQAAITTLIRLVQECSRGADIVEPASTAPGQAALPLARQALTAPALPTRQPVAGPLAAPPPIDSDPLPPPILTVESLQRWVDEIAPRTAPERSQRERVQRAILADAEETDGALRIRGNLYLSGCTALQSLPQGLTVGGNLNLGGWTALQSLPQGLTVGGNLYLSGCTALQSLPQGLTVGENLNLDGCTALQSLPQGLNVGGELDLYGCTALQSLPQGLNVGGNLDLRGCTALQSLPQGLTVGGKLILSGCTALQSLPQGLNVGGNLDLRGCTALRSLPAEIFAWGRTSRGYLRIIDLTGIEFPPATVAQIRAAADANPNIELIWRHSRDPGQHAGFYLTLTRSEDILAQAQVAYSSKSIEEHHIPPHVSFDGEIGIDAGGLRKDFMNLAMRAGFEQQRHWFKADGQDGTLVHLGNLLTASELGTEAQEQLRFFGRMCAMAHLYGLPLPMRLADEIWLATELSQESLGEASCDVLLIIGQMFDAPQFSYYMKLRSEMSAGDVLRQLIEIGDIPDVAKWDPAKLDDHLSDYAKHIISTSCNNVRHFWQGLEEVLGADRYAALTQSPDRSAKLSGTRLPLSHPEVRADWQRNTEVSRVESQAGNQRAIVKAFWDALAADDLPSKTAPEIPPLDAQDQRRLLYLVTGYASPPAGGFAELKPKKFTLHIGSDEGRIPVGHTCFNQLDIPPCTDSTAMLLKLRTFLENCREAFDIS